MSAHVAHHDHLDDPGPLKAPKLKLTAMALTAIGAIAFVMTYFLAGPERAWTAFLIGMLVPTLLSLGALFYLSVHSIGSAVWIAPIRRLMEGMSAGLWITLPAFLILAVLGGGYLYDWINLSGEERHSQLFHVEGGSKATWMNWTRFLIVDTLLIVGLLGLRQYLVGLSLKQDIEGGDIRCKHRVASVIFVMFFAIAITLLVWDLLLSLHVNWFSTMWGPYILTTTVQSFLCVLILLALWLRRGPMQHHLPKHIMHDLGTWMVAWSCFCAYITFSQFMLIYYANLDEETYWYVIRSQNGYGVQYWVEVVLRWPLPFLGLMSQGVRTNPKALGVIASLVLVGNWLDWNWIVGPAFAINEYRCPFELPELLVGAGFLGLFLIVAMRFWSKNGLVAKREAMVLQAVNAEHLH